MPIGIEILCIYLYVDIKKEKDKDTIWQGKLVKMITGSSSDVSLSLERQLNHRYRLIVTDRGAPLPYFALEIPSNVFHASCSCQIAAHYPCSRQKKVTLIAARIVSVRPT